MEEERTIKTKEELLSLLRELQDILNYARHEAETTDFDKLTANYFGDLVCWASDIYFGMGGD